MRHSDPPEELIPTESGTVLSREALTPRGGFMARPGLKAPPTHAVVVRGGDAPLDGAIPVARSSFLPPPPPSDPAALALSEKDTLRAIPRRSSPPPDLVPTPVPAPAALVTPAPAFLDSLRPVIESVPPPSDAPLVASLDDARATPRRRRSPWAIVAAAAAGLLLGMVSVATTMGGHDTSAPVAASPPPAAVELAPRAPERARVTPVPSSRPEPSAKPPVAAARPPEPVRAPPTSPKRSIF